VDRQLVYQIVLAYLAVAVVLLVRALIVRRRLEREPPPPETTLDASAFDGEEIGVIVEGDSRAVAAAVARLRVSGALFLDEDGTTLVTRGEPPPDAGRLAEEVFRVVGTGTTIHYVRQNPSVQAAVAGVRRRTRDAGFVNHERRRRNLAAVARPLWQLAVVGVAGCVVELSIGAPIWPLALATIAVLVAASRVRIGSFLSTPTEDALQRIELANRHLAPAARPALITYGPAAAAVAVGLFGAGALAATDGPLALQADWRYAPSPPAPEREQQTANSGGAGGSACGGCGGCGGGGCGGCGG